ncbi:MAG: redoxin domain-containing protein [Verrucomicrobia bacterium]|jgi:hypothetical protein|nr:redoxin domain-containing protein [Verrucomicrobiota bacterium]
MKPQSIRTTWACLFAGLSLMVSSVFAAEPAAPEKTGLAVGEKAPDWTLKDQHSQNQSLNSLLKKGPVALVFYRSADW